MYFLSTFTLWLCCNSIIYMTHATSTAKSIISLPQSSSPVKPRSSADSNPTPNPDPTCTQPLTAANTAVAPILRGNRLVPAPYRLPDSFIYPHILFVFTDFNLRLPRAAWATFCLDQCVAFAGNRTCRSFEVDQGAPYPPAPEGQSQDKRWWCEGFDVPLSADLFVPNPVPNSYERILGVNRLCGGDGTVRDY